MKAELSGAVLSGPWAGGSVASAYMDEAVWGELGTLLVFPLAGGTKVGRAQWKKMEPERLAGVL